MGRFVKRATAFNLIEILLACVLAVGAGLLVGSVLSPQAGVGVGMIVGAASGFVLALAAQKG